MADMISSSGSRDMAVKSNGVVDMSPTSILAHNVLSNSNCKTALLNLKDLRSTASAADAAEPTNYNNAGEANGSSINADISAANSPPATTFRCERCDNFETSSRAALLLHVVQCLSSNVCLRNDENELDNFKINPQALNDATSKITARETQKTTNSNGIKAATETAGSQHASSSSTSSSSSNNNNSTASSRKVFECDVCNMKFSNGANMRRHKMRHTGVKPYECRVCQKRFFRKDHLAEHFTTHTKTLPYHCPICNRGFQRQIAMRAHFQNEHVGQHDLVKTCPLCSYRAGSMKSLRIHFYNRHGIDLDNPGACGTSSLLLALESQASQVAAAAAVASFVPNLSSVAAAAAAVNSANNSGMQHQGQQSDSSESMRSMENATPPMHFLTPHVEISTLHDNMHENSLNDNPNDGDMNHESNMLLECNIKTPPTSSSSSGSQNEITTKTHLHDNHIAPSISLIPIKQEIIRDDASSEQCKSTELNGGDNSENEFSTPNTSMTSLIKVSPLKSLLREDLKRRICAKANNRMTRNAAASENNLLHSGNNSNATPICNGTITSTGMETDSMMLVNRKQILSCLFCGIDFPDETLYFLHKGCHCESNPWKCNICGEQLNNVYEFNSHLLSKSHQ